MVTASILTLEPLIQAIGDNKDLLEYLMDFVNTENQLDEVQASHWVRVMVHLIASTLPHKYFMEKDGEALKWVRSSSLGAVSHNSCFSHSCVVIYTRHQS